MTIMLPLGDVAGAEDLMRLATTLLRGGQGRLVILGVVEIPEERSLSEGAILARRRRSQLEELIASQSQTATIEIATMVRVSRQLWQGISEAASEAHADLLLLGWKGYTKTPERIFGSTIDEILSHPPCDVAVVRVAGLGTCQRILLPVRGGPYAELALKLALTMAEGFQASITVIHAVPDDAMSRGRFEGDRPFAEFIAELPTNPRVRRVITASGPADQVILQEADRHDVIVMGASAQLPATPIFGPVVESIVHNTTKTVMVVKTRRTAGPQDFAVPEVIITRPLTELVDKWFAENTFHAREFRNLDHLVELKRKQGVSISLGLPALNEEATIGPIIKTMTRELMERHPLLDEIVLIDSDSTDRTVEIARELGIPVYKHPEVLPSCGSYRGKGEALWKSLHVLKGDLIAWIDTDIKNIHPKFVYGILGPLLKETHIQYVKGFYRRPITVGGDLQATGGGRVTELTARPLLNLFFPHLSGIIQPLSGEYAGRRKLLERLPFFTGYGVETGLLIDSVDLVGLDAIAQVDLQVRIHRNQGLVSLSKMAFTIMQVILQRVEQRQGIALLDKMNRSMKLIHYERGKLSLEVKELYDHERPPIVTVPEYRATHG